MFHGFLAWSLLYVAGGNLKGCSLGMPIGGSKMLGDTWVLLSCRSLASGRKIFTTVIPQSVLVHHFRFGFWAQLNSVNQIINPFGDNVWTLPGHCSFLSQKVVQPDSFSSLKWLALHCFILFDGQIDGLFHHSLRRLLLWPAKYQVNW